MNNGIIRLSGKPNITADALRAIWNKSVRPTNRFRQQGDRLRVIDYLQDVEVEGMRKHLCFSCAFVSLYDKNNKRYKVSRTDTIEQVKAIVDEIRKINQAE